MNKKTIALFGGSGQSGIPFLKLALEKYNVKALVRDPSKLNISNSGLEIIQGDILSYSDVAKTIDQSSAVISLIGHVKGSPDDLQNRATQNILKAMEEYKVERLISLTGGGVRDKALDTPGLVDKLVVFAMKNLAGKDARMALYDGIAHAQLIRESNTRWTIVRGPMLTNEPAKNKILVGNVGQISGFKLTREDLAAFIFQTIDSETYIHKMPFITNG